MLLARPDSYGPGTEGTRAERNSFIEYLCIE
jgi:hypothetical protein